MYKPPDVYLVLAMVEPGGGCLPTIYLYLYLILGVRNVITTHIYCLSNFTIASLNTNAIHMRTRIHAHDARTRMRAVS